MLRALLVVSLFALMAIGAQNDRPTSADECSAYLASRGLVPALWDFIENDDRLNLARTLATQARELRLDHRREMLLQKALAQNNGTSVRLLLQEKEFEITRETLDWLRSNPVSSEVREQLWDHCRMLSARFTLQRDTDRRQARLGRVKDEPKLYAVAVELIRSRYNNELEQVAQKNPDFFAKNGAAQSRDDSFMFWIKRSNVLLPHMLRTFDWPADAGEKIPKRLLLTEVAKEVGNEGALAILLRMGAQEVPRKIYPEFLQLVQRPIYEELAEILVGEL